MATVKFSELADAATITGGEYLALTQSGVSKRATTAALALFSRLADTKFMTPERYGADKTGVADSAVALQEWMDNSLEMMIPAGHVYKTSVKLRITNDGSFLTGGGKIVTTAALASSAAIEVAASDCMIEKISLVNPTESQTQSGGKNVGILIRGHRNMVSKVRTRLFQNGIMIDCDGEYYDNDILGNKILDCIGAGDGPSNGSSTFGEDRGDGIVDWGARTHIIGNTVSTKTGTFNAANNRTDCRIGIHCEGLATLSPTTAASDERRAIITGNIVTGTWRRAYSIEDYGEVLCFGNSSDGQWTWCGIWFVQGSGRSMVFRNIIPIGRATGDLSGQAWAPVRAAILAFVSNTAAAADQIIGDNIITALTAAAHGIYALATAGGALGDLAIRLNKITGLANMGSYLGIAAVGLSTVMLESNEVLGGFYRLVYGYGNGGVYLRGGRLYGNVTYTDFLVSIEAGTGENTVDNVDYRNGANGMQLFAPTNIVKNCRSKGITATEILVNGNTLAEVSINTDMDGGGTISITCSGPIRHRNNEGFATFTGSATYDPASLADGAGVTTTVSCPGAATGQFARASFSNDLQGILLTAWVSSANTVSVRFQNESGGTLDLASGTIRVRVETMI